MTEDATIRTEDGRELVKLPEMQIVGVDVFLDMSQWHPNQRASLARYVADTLQKWNVGYHRSRAA
jgi:hypothetical protein